MGKRSVELTPESKTSSKKNDSSTGLKKKRVSGAGARKKGLQFERDIAQRLGHIFPEAERQLESQASSCKGIDLQGTDIIKIQCKNHANYCSVSTINEIRTNDPNDIPVLVTKGIRMEPMAVLPFEKLVTLLEIAYGHSPRLVNPYVKEKLKLTASSPLLTDVTHERRFHIVEAEVVPDTADHSALLDSFI